MATKSPMAAWLPLLLLPLLLMLLLLLTAAESRDAGRLSADVPTAPRQRSCAAPRRSSVQQALDELFTCLVATRVNGTRVRRLADSIDYRGLAGSGRTLAPLLRPLYSSQRLAEEAAPGFRSLTAVAAAFDPQLGRNETRGPRELALIDAYLRHLEASDYVADTFETLRANGRTKALNLRQFVRYTMYQQWFRLYARTKRQHERGLRDSSGFGHVIVGELRGSKVTGFHSWPRLLAAEEAKEFDYKGYVRLHESPLPIGLLQFDWRGRSKALSSFLFGVEPDFELALFTASFVVNPGRRTTFTIAGSRLQVQTFSVHHQPQSVATAYVVG